VDSAELLDQLLKVTDTMSTDMQGYLHQYGLSTVRAHVLWVLHNSGASRQRDLAVALGCTPRHVTTLVDELIANGHVTRSPHPDDRRAVLVELTPQATALLGEMAAARVQLASDLFGHLSVSQRSELGDRLADLQLRISTLIEEQF